MLRNKLSYTLQVRLDIDQYKYLYNRASDMHMTLSQLVRLIIIKYISNDNRETI